MLIIIFLNRILGDAVDIYGESTGNSDTVHCSNNPKEYSMHLRMESKIYSVYYL